MATIVEGENVVRLTVNGEERRGIAEPRTLLSDFLRAELGLTGTHVGCEQGVCGSCSVRLDGELVRSCLVFAVQAEGASLETVEGLATGDELHPVQQAFHEQHGLQCGFCTPGLLIATVDLLERNASPERGGDPRPPGGQRLPLHGVRGHRRRGAGRCSQARRRILMATTETAAPYVGQSVPRVEDGRLLRGLGKFVDDIQLPGMLHAAFVRSPFAHATVTRIDASRARELAGVALVLTAEDIGDLAPIATGLPRDEVVPNNRPVLPGEKVRFVGEAVACVVASSRYVAEDAVQLVDVDYEPLEPVVDAERSLAEGAPLLHDGHGVEQLRAHRVRAGRRRGGVRRGRPRLQEALPPRPLPCRAAGGPGPRRRLGCRLAGHDDLDVDADPAPRPHASLPCDRAVREAAAGYSPGRGRRLRPQAPPLAGGLPRLRRLRSASTVR